MYFLKKTGDRKYIIAMVSDALFFSSAKKDIGIGYLVQNIAREVGIEYILFQNADGIVFSSRRIGPILKIENDSFLSEAMHSDSVLSRVYLLGDRKVLELVKPFSSVEYKAGLFRLGLSLEKYNEYAEKAAPQLQKEHTQKFSGKFQASRAVYQLIL